MIGVMVHYMDANKPTTQEPTTQEDGTFRAVLYPYRSLSPRGFFILMSTIGLVSFTAGIVFWLIGAWPVFGFLGLDVLLIYLAFRFNYRSARAYETIEINGEQLILTRSDPAGRKKRFEFNPYWVRVLLSERNDGRTSLALTSHGQVIEFGRFLNDDERREFASALKYALSTVRAAPNVG